MNLPARSRPSTSGGRPAASSDAAAHRHVVEFYDGEEFLAGTVAGFLGPALNEGDAAVVVATAAHRAAFEVALRRSGVDVGGAAGNGRYLSLDAGELLECFMVAGAPDAGRFAAKAGELIDRAGVGGRRVRIYGEMVSLLWDAGDVLSAVALEDLWNDLSDERDFMLMCAYPMRSFESTASTTAFQRICDQHSTVIPCEDYAAFGGTDAQHRAAARLQQQLAALKADVARLRAQQIVSEVDDAISAIGMSNLRALRGDGFVEPFRESPAKRDASVAAGSHREGSPGGRLLEKSLWTLSSRLRYAD